jgi:hypothetical protein
MASEDVERPACSPGFFWESRATNEAVVVRYNNYIWTTLSLNISVLSLSFRLSLYLLLPLQRKYS